MSTSLLYHAFGVRGYRYVKNGIRRGRSGFHHRTSSKILSVSGLRVGQRDPSGAGSTSIPHRFDRQQAGVFDAGRASGGVPSLRRRSASENRLRRSSRHLHQVPFSSTPWNSRGT